MAKIKEYGFYRVYESIQSAMASVNALLDANTIGAMIKMDLCITLVQSLALNKSVSLINVSFFIICKVKVQFATFISHSP